MGFFSKMPVFRGKNTKKGAFLVEKRLYNVVLS